MTQDRSDRKDRWGSCRWSSSGSRTLFSTAVTSSRMTAAPSRRSGTRANRRTMRIGNVSRLPVATAISPEVRGTFAADGVYKKLDIVAFNGGSFIARRDNPGECPGPGWQLLTKQGKSGDKGAKGERGESGNAGARGERGEPGTTITGWEIDRDTFHAVPLMSDGKSGPPLELRALFEQFHTEAR